MRWFRVRVKKKVTKREKLQRQRNIKLKKQRIEKDSLLEDKGKIVRQLNKKGVKEIEGKKLYYYDYSFLVSYLDKLN